MRPRWWGDAAALTVLLALVAAGFQPVYRTGWVAVAVVGCGALGMALAAVATTRRYTPLQSVGLGAAAWFILGGFLMMPSSTIAWVVPTPRTLQGLATGPFTAWRDMLTLPPPIGETYNLLTVPGAVGLLAGGLSMWLSLRGRGSLLPFLPPAGAYLIAALLGSEQAWYPHLTGALFFGTSLVWISWRRAAERARVAGTAPRARPLGLLGGAAMLLLAGAVAAAVVPVLTPGPRGAARAHLAAPLAADEYPSPLQAFRANLTQTREETLFVVEGGTEGQLLRVATLEDYDGLRYRVAGAHVGEDGFTRVGQWIADDSPGDDTRLRIWVRAPLGVWVPTTGQTTSVAFDGPRATELGDHFYYNRSTGTGLVTTGLQPDDGYTLSARLAPRRDDAAIARAAAGSASQPPDEGVPDELANIADAWTEGATTAGARAQRIESRLREGYFSHGLADEAPSLPGHSIRRLGTLLADEGAMVGDDEQYAVAMALMARGLGIPARVTYGYRLGAGQNVTGDMVGAWPELNLQGLGWVTFDPTPPRDRTLEDEQQPTPPQDRPFVENPPPPAQRPVVPPADEELPVERAEPPEQPQEVNWARIGALAALSGIPLLLLVAPAVVIVSMKARRRARRRGAATGAGRVAGAWADVVDTARDLGRPPTPTATRSEQAEALVQDFPRLADPGSDPLAAARQADGLVFAPGEPSAASVSDYRATASGVRSGMRRSVSPVRWWASHVSTRSFRRQVPKR